MKFKELYSKGLDRKVNPAVSASDLSEDTVMTEIVEYVFTEEIVINLYDILVNIRQNQGSHVGIWINGYFGTGKSHFLKYVSYCLNAHYSEMAFMRLEEAIEEIMRNSNGMTKLDDHGVSLSEIQALKKWYSTQAEVQMVMFNIGDVHDANSNQAQAFTTIFWNQFNAQRGYNSFNLALAQYLEKALDDDGKFGEFKDYLKSKGYDWERNISRFAAGRLDLALQMAKEVDPTLATDVIRTKILNNDINVSVESFAAEMKEYIEAKDNRNFRLLFFVDEVSQFIGEHRDLLLQLQSLVKRLEEVCESRVWIACTAQQTLEEVVSHVGGSTTNPEDEVGKILGRFEVRASLQGTSPEYITQKRILDKKGEAEVMLADMYAKDKAKLDAQFVLPSTYKTYRDKDNFVAYYPFVPYQFQLIKKVLDSFETMNYVDKQVKGNERSLINITYSIARETQDMEVGEFIPFDKFFGAMVQGSMQHLGQRAFENARQALDVIEDEKKQAFYRRVVYILFMICNLKEEDKQQFSATIDNVVTLLMSKVDASKAAIKQAGSVCRPGLSHRQGRHPEGKDRCGQRNLRVLHRGRVESGPDYQEPTGGQQHLQRRAAQHLLRPFRESVQQRAVCHPFVHGGHQHRRTELPQQQRGHQCRLRDDGQHGQPRPVCLQPEQQSARHPPGVLPLPVVQGESGTPRQLPLLLPSAAVRPRACHQRGTPAHQGNLQATRQGTLREGNQASVPADARHLPRHLLRQRSLAFRDGNDTES